MKRVLALLIIYSMILSLCSCGSDDEALVVPEQLIRAHISDDLPLYEIKAERIGITDELPEEAVYLVEVLKPRADGMVTEQLLTVRSTVTDDAEILDLYDVSFDGCSDLIVRYSQTPHSAAWYHAYRWLVDEQRFEAEPFFEFCCSGKPVVLPESRQLATRDVTLSNVEETLYTLDADGSFSELRRCCTERYDCCRYIIEELQDGEWATLCDERFSLGEEISVQDRARLTSLFYYGNNWSLLNDIMRFAEQYACCRESSGVYGFEHISEMLLNSGEPCDEELYNSEKQYAESAERGTSTVSSYYTGISYTDNCCRVNVAVRTSASGNGSEPDCPTKYLAIDVSPDIMPLHICGVSEGLPPTQDDNAIFDIEYCEDGRTAFYFLDSEHNRLEQSFWPKDRYIPEMEFVDDTLLEFHQGAGTGVWVSVYYDVAARRASSDILNSFYLDNNIILLLDLTEDGRVCIRIRDIFDENRYCCELYPDFAPVANPFDASRAFELLDGSHLSITYTDSQWRTVTQEFEIPDIYE